jgi:TnpA family transposase
VAASLKLGTLSASELSVPCSKEKALPVARALGELGRIPKTLHLLTFIDEPFYRRRILTQLNRGKGRHRLARSWPARGTPAAVPRASEDQLGAFGLVVGPLVRLLCAYTAHGG